MKYNVLYLLDAARYAYLHEDDKVIQGWFSQVFHDNIDEYYNILMQGF